MAQRRRALAVWALVLTTAVLLLPKAAAAAATEAPKGGTTGKRAAGSKQRASGSKPSPLEDFLPKTEHLLDAKRQKQRLQSMWRDIKTAAVVFYVYNLHPPYMRLRRAMVKFSWRVGPLIYRAYRQYQRYRAAAVAEWARLQPRLLAAGRGLQQQPLAPATLLSSALVLVLLVGWLCRLARRQSKQKPMVSAPGAGAQSSSPFAVNPAAGQATATASRAERPGLVSTRPPSKKND